MIAGGGAAGLGAAVAAAEAGAKDVVVLVARKMTEGDYTPRLEFLQELPPKKILGHFDQIDRKKAKKLLGDTCVFEAMYRRRSCVRGRPNRSKTMSKN